MASIESIPVPVQVLVGGDEPLIIQELPEMDLKNAYYQRMLNLRSAVGELMTKHSAGPVQEGSSWLLFDRVEDTQQEPLAPRADICVASELDPLGRSRNPIIRIILIETLPSDNRLEHFVIDATVDNTGGSQYSLGVVPADTTETEEGSRLHALSIENNRLVLNPSFERMKFHQSQPGDIDPQTGYSSSTVEQCYAIHVAHKLLGTVLGREPSRTSQKN